MRISTARTNKKKYKKHSLKNGSHSTHLPFSLTREQSETNSIPIPPPFEILTVMRSFSICVCARNGFAAPERERTKGNLVCNMVLADIKVGKQLCRPHPPSPICFTCCTLERNLFYSNVEKRTRARNINNKSCGSRRLTTRNRDRVGWRASWAMNRIFILLCT